MAFVFTSSPVDGPIRITSYFGKRDIAIKGARKEHPAVDLGGDRSKAETGILAVAKGTIILNEWNIYRGWNVIIDHGNREWTRYQHLKNKCLLPVGTVVKSGQQIGIMGNSSDKRFLKVPIHLHFELIIKGVNENPLPYLQNIVPEEDEEMVKKIKIEVDGKVIEVDAILQGNFNYVQLADIVPALSGTLSYDAAKKMPIVKSK